MSNKKEVKGYTLNLTARTLTITKEFEEAIAVGRKAECAIYNRLMKQIPGLQVVRKTHATPRGYNNKNGRKTRRNQFKNLTYENMERFMNAIPNNEEYLAEYEFGRKTAARFQINGYALVRTWFAAQFPEYFTNPFSYLRTQPKVVYMEDVQKQMAEEKAAKEDSKKVG